MGMERRPILRSVDLPFRESDDLPLEIAPRDEGLCRTYGARVTFRLVSQRFLAGLSLCRAYGAGWFFVRV